MSKRASAVAQPVNVYHADDLVAVVRSRGSDARDLRDAVHEATHALQAMVPPPWDRERIHGYLVSSCSDHNRMAALLDREIRARAAEMHACHRFGIAYDTEHWSMIAAMETGKTTGIWVPLQTMRSRVVALATGHEAKRMVDRISRLRRSRLSKLREERIAEQQAKDELLRREQWTANEVVRATAARIAEQTRHDVAAAVARHVDVDDAAIRRLRDGSREGTASDALVRRVCSTALGEDVAGRPMTPDEIADARQRCADMIARRREAAETLPDGVDLWARKRGDGP